MNSIKTARGLLARAPLATAVAVALLSAPAAQAFEFREGQPDRQPRHHHQLRHLGAHRRTPNRSLIGKVQFDPASASRTFRSARSRSAPAAAAPTPCPGSAYQIAAPGRFSVNRDDGDLKYDKGDAFSNAFKITSELSLKWEDTLGRVRPRHLLL